MQEIRSIAALSQRLRADEHEVLRSACSTRIKRGCGGRPVQGTRSGDKQPIPFGLNPSDRPAGDPRKRKRPAWRRPFRIV